MKTTTVATYERESTIWANARTDKKTAHFVEMVCEVIDYDVPSEIEAKYGFKPAQVLVDGNVVHKAFKVQCKGVNGQWTVLGMFYDDKQAANKLVKEILNHSWYKGWKKVS